MNLENSKVLVIGGAGFIGSFVIKELLKTNVKEIIIYDNFSRGKMENIEESLKDSRCSIYPFGGDVREIDVLNQAMEGVDYVFHLAAMWLLHCKDFPRTAFHVNIEGTFNVMEACVKNKVKKLIYSSSASVYGDAVELPMTENHPFNNTNFYGATKIAGEAMATAYNDRYKLPIIGLRYMNVYGPGQDQHAAYTGVVPIMLNKIEANEAPTINGDGSQAYDFIYVEDIARCNIAALESDVDMGFYNVGTEVQTSIKELCDTILDLKGSDLKVKYKPYSEDDARQFVKNRIGSRQKAEKELGFKFKYSLREGLQKLIDWRIEIGIDKKKTVVNDKIPLIRPFINQEIKDNVVDVLESRYLTEGPVTREFESVFKDYIGSKHAIAVTSCTTGLEVALRCLGIGEGDEVIVPDYTYPATASVVPIVGAKVVIVDSNKEDMLIDYDELEKAITSKTKAIIPVSGFGNPLDYERLNKIKEKYGLYIIEDAACSIGAEYKNKKVGTFADISVFSLHPRKFITTGEGGMITTDNDEWAKWMYSYKHFGINNSADRKGIIFDKIGTNYKLSNVSSAIGLAQMKHVESLLEKRLKLADNYVELFKKHNIVIPKTTKDGKHSRQSFCIYVNDRDRIMTEMREEGIEVQIGTYALHQHPAFNNHSLVELKGDFKDSTYAFEHCLTLPLFDELTFKQQEIIVNKLVEKIK